MTQQERRRTQSAAAPPAGPLDELERAVMDNLYDGVYYVDRGRRIRYWNHGAERLSGYAATDVVGHFCYDNILSTTSMPAGRFCAGPSVRWPRRCAMASHARRSSSCAIARAIAMAQVHTAPVRDREGKVIAGVEIFEDSTKLNAVRREVTELRDLAMHDALTGLPHRRHFEMSMSSRIAELAGYGRRFGFLTADIDKFKLVNDRYGHAIGDVALRTVARTLLASSRPGDDIARFGGEEFALTVADVDEAALRAIAERFRAMVERTRVRTEEHTLKVRISLGGTIGELGDTAEAIFERADSALYAAKNAGRNRVCLSG